MNATAVVDINCDLGEGAGHDDELLPLVTSINVACGAHAGDQATMERLAARAGELGISLGAHPGYPDRAHFGRRIQNLDTETVRELVRSQILALQACGRVRHVKPHGALYNQAGRDRALADAIAAAVADVDRALVLYGGAGGALLDAGRAAGLRVASEVFADRSYQADGSLTPRTEPGAMIEDEDIAVAQVREMLLQGTVQSIDGTRIPVVADTICVHGDQPQAVGFSRKLRAALATAGIAVRPYIPGSYIQ